MNLTTKNIMPLSNSNDLLLVATLFFGRQPEMGVISPPTIDFLVIVENVSKVTSSHSICSTQTSGKMLACDCQ